MNINRDLSSVLCVLMLLLLLGSLTPQCFAVSQAEASAAVENAEQNLNSAFVAVAEAEAAGADVSALLDRLSSAGDSLSEARHAFSIGAYETAYSFAVACSSAVDGIALDAASLKVKAEEAKREALVSTVLWSSVGLILLSVFGVVGWRMLEKWYFKRVLDLKPGVSAE